MFIKSQNKNRDRKFLSLFFVFSLVFVFVVSFIGPAVNTASTEGGPPIPTAETASVPTALQIIKDKALSTIELGYEKSKDILKKTAALGYRQGIKFFLETIARDTAISIVSGGKGQQPLFETQGWGSYLADVADSTVGIVLDEATTGPNAFLPLGICQPRAGVALRVNLGLATRDIPDRPKCTFSVLKNNWEQAIRSVNFLPEIQRSFNVAENDLGIALTAQTNLINLQQQKKLNAQLKRLENQGAKPVVGLLSDTIETPGKLVFDTWNSVFNTTVGGMMEFTGDALADAVDVFMNTLATGFINKLLVEGLSGESGGGRNFRSGNINYEAMVANEGVIGATVRFARDINPNFAIPGRYNVLSQLVSCDQPSNPGPNDCVITDNFNTAIGQRLTVSEAIDGGFINGNAPFGFVGWDPSPIEPSYIDGIPYRSILILRKYRIIPVGWELAARYIENFGKQQIGLSELMAAYDEPSSPYYRLIDPNWVLVPPDAFCKLQGPGPEIISTQVQGGVDLNGDGKFDGDGESPPSIEIARDINYCTDEQTCIKRDSQGNCQFYGYCTEEKRTWDFGSSRCEPYYATCSTLENQETGTTVSYLLNTAQGWDVCDANSVGCAQYSQNKLTDIDWSTDNNDSVYLNNRADNCSLENVGCRAFVSTASQLPVPNGVNLITNPSFEFTNGPNNALPWFFNTGVEVVEDTGIDGNYYLRVNNSQSISRGVIVGPLSNAVLTLSFYARQSGDTKGTILYELKNTDANVTFSGETEILSDSWSRLEATIEFPDNDSLSDIVTLKLTPPDKTDIDAVKLEVGRTATSYTDYGLGVNNDFLRLKEAPSYLGCVSEVKATNDIDPNADKNECQPYARSCVEEEVGCLNYIPDNGTASITSVRGDVCPSECVGLDTYTQAETFFESAKFEDLIPSSAQSCSATSVGCDEFTNLDVEALGGEAREYYQQVRFCEKPGGGDKGVFYTWEGSDESGFQLRVFELKETNTTSSAPCTNISWNDDGVKAECVDDEDRGNIASDLCNENNYDTNPDCRQFYNDNGDISYRLLSRTVSVTDSCRPLRKTDSNQVDCEGSNGWWNSVTKACIYQAVPGEGRQCNAVTAGCREYRGGTAANYEIIMNDTFERGTSEWEGGKLSAIASVVGGHSYEILDSAMTKDVGVSIGARTSLNGERVAPSTYILTFWARNQINNTNTVEASFEDSEGNIQAIISEASLTSEWQQFQSDPITVSNLSTENVLLEIATTGDGRLFVDDIQLRTTTDTYYLIKNSGQIPASCQLTNTVSMLGCQAYEVSDGASRNIWQFGEACNEKVVGCEAFIDTQNTTLGPEAPFAKTFSDNKESDIITIPADKLVYRVNNSAKYCEANVQGCELLGALSTRNSALRVLSEDVQDCAVDEPLDTTDLKNRLIEYGYQDIANKVGSVCGGGTLVATDALRILADLQEETEISLINNPDDYSNTLCRAEQVQCSAFTSDGNLYYFKDPQNQVCEYRLDKPVTGWYTKGTDSIVPNCNRGVNKETDPRVRVAGGVPEPLDGWVGLCPVSANSCREFFDPRSDDGSNLLINGSFILEDANNSTKPHGWNELNGTSITSFKDNSILFSVSGVDKGLAQTVTLRERTQYVLSAEVRANGIPDESKAAYLGIECGGALSSRPYAFFSPTSNQQERYERFSTSFYVLEKDSIDNCQVKIGLAANLLDPSVAGYSDFETSEGVWFRNVSLREARLNYELRQQVDLASCVGTVNNVNCILVDDSIGISNDLNVSALQYDADNSPLGGATGPQIPNASLRPEYACLDTNRDGNPDKCNGTNVSCQTDRDCQLQLDSNLLVKVTPDRECGAWLSCRTARTITEGNVSRKVCLEVDGCEAIDEKGQCVRSTPDIPDSNLTYSKANIDLIKDRSGYSKVGFDWDPDKNDLSKKRILQGYLSPSFMPQTGFSVELLNGNFELATPAGSPTGWLGWDNGGNYRVIDNPVAAQDAGVFYPIEGSNFLEVNANHKVPRIEDSNPELNNQPIANMTRKIPVAPNTTYIISAQINTRHFSGESAEIRIFEYNQSQEAVIHNGNSYSATLNLGPGFDWKLMVDKITTQNTTRFISLQLAWNNENNESGYGYWYIDDLKIQPALEYQKNEFGGYINPDFPQVDYERGLETLDYKYAPQSCRLFPKEDSLSCRYVDDEGLRQRGKTGYCLEWDPQNSNYCLQWWPVDSIAGEGIEEDRSGYNDRYPVYYCLETLDGYVDAKSGIFDKWVLKNGNQIDSVGTDIRGGEPLIFDITYQGGAPTNEYAVGGLVDKPGDCEANIDEGTHQGCELIFNAESNSGEGLDMYEVGVSNDLNKWYFVTTWCEGSKSSSCKTELGDYGSSVNGVPDDDPRAHDGNQYMYADIAWAVDREAGGIPVNGPFRYLRIKAIGPRGGGIEPVKLYGAWVRPNFSCNAVVQAVTQTGDAKTRAGRLVEGSSYKVQVHASDPLALYGRDTDFAPFGGAVPPEPVEEPLLWDTSTRGLKQPLFPQPFSTLSQPFNAALPVSGQARAGAPYSCRVLDININGGQQVQGGTCIVNGDITACEVGDTCIGGSECIPDGSFIQPPSLVGFKNPDCSSYLSRIDIDSATSALTKVISQLFVETYGVWEWSPSCVGGPNQGLSCLTNNDCPDSTCSGDYSYAISKKIPNLVPPTEICNNNDRSKEVDVCGVSPIVPEIRLSPNEPEVKTIGSVTLSFNVIADPDQLPIKQYIVDWGDGTKTVQTGLRLANRPSFENAISLLHIYSFDDIDRCFNISDCNSSNLITKTSSDEDEYKVTPRVQVIDNWGWCNNNYNGNVSNPSPLGQEGYNELVSPGCRYGNGLSWKILSIDKAITVKR